MIIALLSFGLVLGCSGIPGGSQNLIWKGSLSSAPNGASQRWTYYNTVDKNVYIFNNGGWELYLEVGELEFNFWLVHEPYSDTQRLTKMIIDAGEGRAFKASSIDKDTFKVSFRSEHWHPEHHDTHGLATETGVGYGYRIIDDAYVIDDIAKNLPYMESRDLTERQQKLPSSSVGRYIVLEFYSERELKEAGFIYDPVGYELNNANGILGNYQQWQRTPGAESGWNSHNDRMMQHKHIYGVEILKPFDFFVDNSKSKGLDISTNDVSIINQDVTKEPSSSYDTDPRTFKKFAHKWNENEIVPGEIQVIFNNYEDLSYGGGGYSRYRLLKPMYGSGARPLFVWCHGADGTRIDFSPPAPSQFNLNPLDYWASASDYEFLNNHGQLTTGPSQLGNRAIQQKYGGFYVLAPQADTGHNPVALKGLIDHVIANNNIDPTRIYIAGHSMGGMATINSISLYPNFFAAAIPAPGSGGTSAANFVNEDVTEFGPSINKVTNATNTPLWLFTIRGDNTAMDSLTIDMYNKIRNASGNNVRMTYYPVLGYTSFPDVPTPNANMQWIIPNVYGGLGYDYPGNYGLKGDPVSVPGGFGWSHSAYEPAMSDKVTTDGQWNVGFTNKNEQNYSSQDTQSGSGFTAIWQKTSYMNFQWGYLNPLDTAGDTTFTWAFKQRRTNPNSLNTPSP